MRTTTMKCCDKAYYVIESGVALCRNCGATKAVAAPASPGAWPSDQFPNAWPYAPYLPQVPYTTPIWNGMNGLPFTGIVVSVDGSSVCSTILAQDIAKALGDPAKAAFYVGL